MTLAPQINSHPEWQERQSFLDNPVARVVLGLVALALLVGGVLSFTHGAPGVAVAVGVSLLLVALLVGLGLRTEVRDEGLRVALGPIAWTYRWTDIASAAVREYRPLRDYGGWGLRLGPAGLAWNAYGNRGVQLVLRSGRHVLIGSQDPDALAAQIAAKMESCAA